MALCHLDLSKLCLPKQSQHRPRTAPGRGSCGQELAFLRIGLVSLLVSPSELALLAA